LEANFEKKLEGNQDEAQEEALIIFLSYTIVYPSAMMIETLNTSITLSTVFTSFIGV
jgi:hypothetical protein